MMKMTDMKKMLSLLLCIVLIAAMALFTTGCSDNSSSSGSTGAPVSETTKAPDPDDQVLGEGSSMFLFTVVNLEGAETSFEIHTDKTTIGEALLELGLIAGDSGDYGLYVKTVNGLTIDYEKDGKYWAFYMNGEYSLTGVDVTEITEGATYTFKAE